MELCSIKKKLSELQSYYHEDTKSDDDIIYVVYNWVKNAHAVAQMLLLEGRFQELQCCLKLCFSVLHEQHVEGDGRTVLRNAGCEDRLLVDALLVRTTQLERQCMEAKKSTNGRDTEYYMKKIRYTTGEKEAREGNRVGEKQTKSPPERGTFFGSRTQPHQLRTEPLVLPPLVTPSQHLFHSAIGAYGMSRFNTCVRLENEDETEEEEEVGENDKESGKEEIDRREDSGSSSHIKDVEAAAGEAAQMGSQDAAVGENVALSFSTFPPLMRPSPLRRKMVPDALSSVISLGEGCPVRPLSANYGNATGTCVKKTNMDTYIMKTAISIISADNVRHCSTAVMQGLNKRVSRLVTRRSTPVEVDSDATTERTEVGQEMSEATTGVSSAQKVYFYNSVFSPLMRGDNNTAMKHECQVSSFSPNCPMEVVQKKSLKNSCSAASSENRDAFQLTRSEEEEEEKERPLNVVENTSALMSYVNLQDPSYELSPAAKQQVEEVYQSYQQKTVDLKASMEMMYQTALNQINRFHPNGRAVQREDTKCKSLLRPENTSFSEQRTVSPTPISTHYVSVARCSPSSGTNDSEGVSRSADGQHIALARPPILRCKKETSATNIGNSGSGKLIMEACSTSLDAGELTARSVGGISLLEAHVQCDTTEADNQGRAADDSISARNADEAGASEPTTRPASRTRMDESPGLPVTSAELRFMMLKSSTHIPFPEVHQMVLKRAEVQLEKEQRFARSYLHSSSFSPITGSDAVGTATITTSTSNNNDKSAVAWMRPVLSYRTGLNELECMRQRECNNGENVFSISVPETTTTALWRSLAMMQRRGGVSGKKSGEAEPSTYHKCPFWVKEEHEDAAEGDEEKLHPQLLFSLAKLHSHPDWARIDAVSLGLCSTLHLAVVRIQCARRRILAVRERNYRADAVERHLEQMATCEKSIIIIQQYMRGTFARRQVLTVVLRLSYRHSQCVVRDAPLKDSVSDDTSGSSFLFPRHRLSLVSLETVSEELDSTGTQRRFKRDGRIITPHSGHLTSGDSAPQPNTRRMSERSSVHELYGSPTRRNTAKQFRMGRLCRIQQNIACRVIVRAFRMFLQQTMLRREKEMRDLLKFVTRQLNACDVFSPPDFSRQLGESAPSRTLNSLSNVRNSTSISHDQVILPTPDWKQLIPLTGDVVAAWEARMVKARRQGDFMTPLEHVKLTELQRILHDREHADELRLLEKRDFFLEVSEKRSQKGEVGERKRRTRLDAALLLQRCMRGYRLRCWFHVLRQRVITGDLITLYQRKAESLSDGAPDMVCFDVASPALKIPGKGEQVFDEDHPIPVHIADAIMQSIHQREPLCFIYGITRRRYRIEVTLMIQRFLRRRASITYTAYRYASLCAVVIQRNWRLVVRRRKLLKSVKVAQMLLVLRDMEY